MESLEKSNRIIKDLLQSDNVHLEIIDSYVCIIVFNNYAIYSIERNGNMSDAHISWKALKIKSKNEIKNNDTVSIKQDPVNMINLCFENLAYVGVWLEFKKIVSQYIPEVKNIESKIVTAEVLT